MADEPQKNDPASPVDPEPSEGRPADGIAVGSEAEPGHELEAPRDVPLVGGSAAPVSSSTSESESAEMASASPAVSVPDAEVRPSDVPAVSAPEERSSASDDAPGTGAGSDAGGNEAASPEPKVEPSPEAAKPARFAFGLPKDPPGRKRLFALAAAVVMAVGLGALATWRRPPMASVAELGADGGDAGADAEAEPAVAITSSSAQALPGPKDPAPASTAPHVWRVASYKDDPNATFTEGTVGKRTLSGALAHAGMRTSDVHRLLKAFEGKKKLDRARPKDTFVFAVDKAKGRVVAFELCSGPSDVWQAREENDTLVVKKLELAVEKRKIAVGFAVEGELHEAVTRAGLDDDVLKRLDDALDGHFELSDLRPGTRLRMVLTELRVEGAFSRYAHVDAVEVRPPTGTGQVRVYRFDDEAESADSKDGKPEKHRHKREHPSGYFDAKGHQPYHGGWRSPVPGARISSRFNPHRLHPVLHVVMPHNGIDFAAPTGAKVYAASAGTVIVAGNGGPCGNMVQIEHPGGLVTAYCHLSRFATGLHPGQHVDTRQLVGYVGATGRVTGPHLHFALKKNAQFVDPMSLKMDGVRVLPPGDREAFAAARQALDAALDAVALPAAPALGDAGSKDEEVFDEGDDDDAGTKSDAGN